MTASRVARDWPGRRPLLAAALALPAARAASAAPPPHAGWESFVARHLRPEGRAVDAAAGGISHSGGQAWTMLIPERFGDRRSFDAALGWTRAALMRRPDHLLCWRWNPATGAVEDANNATDADLCFAWALLRAEARWPGQGYRALARAVAADIRRHLLLPVAGRLVLLPGAWGFEAAEEVVLKPSHYVFPALDALARAFPDPAWPRVIADGERLCEEARFGRWGLPADQVALPRCGGTPRVGRGQRFAVEGARVPLHLTWGGRGTAPAVRAAAAFWSDREGSVPAWVGLETGAVSSETGEAGLRAVAQFTLAARAGWGRPETLPSPLSAATFHDAALTLLARIAWRDIGLPAHATPGGEG